MRDSLMEDDICKTGRWGGGNRREAFGLSGCAAEADKKRQCFLLGK